MTEKDREQVKQLNAVLYRFSAWEKRFLVGLKNKKKEEELTENQRIWLEDLHERLEKQIRYRDQLG